MKNYLRIPARKVKNKTVKITLNGKNGSKNIGNIQAITIKNPKQVIIP